MNRNLGVQTKNQKYSKIQRKNTNLAAQIAEYYP